MYHLKIPHILIFRINAGVVSSKDVDDTISCSWSRMVALHAFAGCMVVRSYEVHKPNLAQVILNALSDFVCNDKRMVAWIVAKGGWVSVSSLTFFIIYYIKHSYF